MSVQLGLGLNRRQGGFNPFTPTHLNPYLLFDTRTSMLGELESPTLDLDPAVPSSLDVITATRSGVATYTDADGVIQSASPNTVRVDHVQGEELTPTKYQRVGYTDFSVFSFPYGWQTAGTVAEGGGYEGQPSVVFTAQSSWQYISIGMPTKAGVTYTGSIWVRRISGNKPIVIQHSASATGTNSAFKNVTTEWTRIEAQFLGNSSDGNVFFGVKIQSLNAAGTSVEIAMPQVEEGTSASDFVPNTTGAPLLFANATYAPRVPMILVEPSATNLVTYSNLSTSGGWSVLGFSLTQNAIASPDGLNNGTKMERTAEVRNFRGSFISSATDTAVTYSFWTKRGSGDTHLNIFRIRVNGNNQEGAIDLATGEVLLNQFGEGNMSVEAFADGWFRVTATRDTGINIGDVVDIYPPYKSTEGDAVGVYNYTFGHQLEYGSVATSFIPTSGSTVTRQADNLVISGSDFTDFYNQSEGTWYCEGVPRSLVNGRYLTVSDATTNNRVIVYEQNGLSRFFVAKDDVSQTFLSNNASSINNLNRIAASYKLNNFLTSANGTQFELPDTSGTPPTSVNRMNVGSNELGLLQLNGHIKRLIYWPTHSDSL